MLISSFLPSTGGQGSEQRPFSLTVRQRDRILWGKQFCTIIITKATKGKSKKQFQHGVRIGFLAATLRFGYLHTCTCMLSHFSPVRLFVTPWTRACQIPLTVGFSRQEYWSGWPCPPPGYLPDPVLKSSREFSPGSVPWELSLENSKVSHCDVSASNRQDVLSFNVKIKSLYQQQIHPFNCKW